MTLQSPSFPPTGHSHLLHAGLCKLQPWLKADSGLRSINHRDFRLRGAGSGSTENAGHTLFITRAVRVCVCMHDVLAPHTRACTHTQTHTVRGTISLCSTPSLAPTDSLPLACCPVSPAITEGLNAHISTTLLTSSSIYFTVYLSASGK